MVPAPLASSSTTVRRSTPFRGVPTTTGQPHARSPAFIKHRAASRAAHRQALSTGHIHVDHSGPAWMSMSGSLLPANVLSERLTSAHICSGKLDSRVSYPAYNVSPPRRARTATLGETRVLAMNKSFSATWPDRSVENFRADPVLANDTGHMQGTRVQKWSLVGKAKYDSTVIQPNWTSSDKFFGKGGLNIRTPRFSPIKKNHVNSSKRELEIYGSRPVSPTRSRPERVSQYELYSRPSRDGSFGDDYNQRVFGTAYANNVRQRPRRRPDPHHTAGPGNKVQGVSVMSGRIDTILPGY